jgi:PAS domain S-box-containing protein
MTEARGGSRSTHQPLDQPATEASIATLHSLLIESVVDYAIFVLDTRGHVLSWNTGAERMKGYSADEIIGKRFSVFYTREDVAAEKPERELQVATREGRVEDEGWRVRKDGSRFWASVVIAGLRDTGGQLIGFAKVTRDLTARRDKEDAGRRQAAAEGARAEAERQSGHLAELNERLQGQAVELEAQTEEAQALAEELEQSNEELHEALATAEHARAEAEVANRAKADFLRTVSHELRTPLNAIEGYVQLLQMGIPEQATLGQLAYLTHIQSAQRHLLSLVNNVLRLERIEAGGMEYRVESVPVHELWDVVEALVTPQLRAKGLGYHAGSCDPAICIRADRDKTVQALLNLVGNAIKFTPAGGQIGLDVDARAADVALRVRDTGMGIEPDNLETIFEPFVQGDALMILAQGGGVGLGLSISRQLARQMGGDVTVESIVGLGSTFTLTLPRTG